jgi:hypothetical protein
VPPLSVTYGVMVVAEADDMVIKFATMATNKQARRLM